MEIKRDLYLTQLINRKHNRLIKIISGVRRCGKSYLLSEIFVKHLLESGVDKKHIIHISLDIKDDEKYRDPSVCNDYVKSLIKDDKMYYLLLDEIQMMDDFESVLNGFLHIKNLDVYVTGSNSKFLSTDIITEFRGRGDEIRVYPLSFSDIYPLFDNDWNIAWEQYSIFGGMPLTLTYKENSDKIKYLKKLFKETYLKDIIERNKLKNEEEFEELSEILASSIGSLTNPTKLENSFSSKKHVILSATTIKQYITYLQDAFLVDKVLRYDVKGKKYINTPFKCYFADIGLRNACIDFRQIEEPHIMENVIYNELKIRGYTVDVGSIYINEKTKDKKYVKKSTEIDFIARLGNKQYYIQSALSLGTSNKIAQEERSLLEAKNGFKKIIITGGNMLQPYQDENGIIIIGLKDFLLNKNSLDF